MLSTLLTLALTAAPTADDVVSAAFKADVDTKPETLKPSEGPSLMVPGLALAGLAGLALVLKRRKTLQHSSSSIAIVESASLGEKRSLVVADVMGERLVLGVSEAGVTVLMNRPSPLVEAAPLVLPQSQGPEMSFIERLTGHRAPASFESELRESMEDRELRAKLQAGLRSVVP